MVLSRLANRAGAGLKQMAPEAPKNTLGAVLMIAEAMRGSSETLGTWPLFRICKAIIHAMKDKDKKTVASECDERNDCVQLNSPELKLELYELRRLLATTMLFSRKRCRRILFAAGFDKDDILLREKTAGILKPAYTVVCHQESKCFYVLIRGTQSIKDTLTDVIGAPVPFELTKSKVSGYAHRGMLSAANWIEKNCVTKLLEALRKHTNFKVKIVGHSLGGGTAALLTYKLRQIHELSSCTCVTFGPAACVTLELAEFGKPFITSIINGSDIVPTLSAVSVQDFISKGQSKNKKHFLTAVGSRLPFAKAIAERIATRHTKFVMKHRQGTCTSSETASYESVQIDEEQLIMVSMPDDDDEDDDEYNEGSDSDDSDEDENELMNQVGKVELEKQDDYDEDEYNEGSDSDDLDDEDKLMSQVAKLELAKQDNVPKIIHSEKKEAAICKNISDEQSICSVPTSVNSETPTLYPPGKIMHIVHATSSEKHNSDRNYPNEKRVYLYETPTQLYGKLRLARGNILHHLTNSYRKELRRLICQLEKESTTNMMIDESKIASEKN